MKEKPESVFRVATPMRSLAQRFAFLLLLGASVGLLMVGRTDPQIFERARMSVLDATAPLLDAMSRPIATAQDLVEQARGLAHLHDENARLRAENARLHNWYNAARTLIAENGQLRDLLHFVADNPARSVTARVIGDANGPFLRSLLVNAGARDGIERGQSAMTGNGLLGRVASVGERSARILLINDLNSRIPVLVEASRARAVLAGDNSDRPRLTYLSANADVPVGARIVTSGHGGVFPPGLPIGTVDEIGDAGVRVRLFTSSHRLEYVRLVDFGLNGVVSRTRAAATSGR